MDLGHYTPDSFAEVELGIGASAGGVEAPLRRFFEQRPVVRVEADAAEG